MLYLGLDIGGTKIAAVIMNESGEELGRYRTDTVKTDYNAFLDHLIDFIQQIQVKISSDYGIGIALPGGISPLSGKIKNSNILVINGQDLKGDLERRLGLSVTLENDGNCFALSEACDGAGKGADIVYGVTLGTGCGGGLAIFQRPFPGAFGNAGESGHISLPGYSPETDGPPIRCYCGKMNCAESFVSGTGLAERYNTASGEALSAPEVIQRAREGNPLALRQVQRFKDQLARLLATIVNIVDPHVIVLGGGLSNEPLITENIADSIGEYVFTDHFCTPVRLALHGDSSGMRGAAWLALRKAHSQTA